MLALPGALVAGFISLLIARRWRGANGAICAILLGWMIAIILTVCVAAMVRGDGTGNGVQGEHVDHSRQVVAAGFWISVLCSVIGFLWGRLRMRWARVAHTTIPTATRGSQYR
jgi:uncharacterized PurR-regulated membrane protein YhhQ (DUF165 family)